MKVGDFVMTPKGLGQVAAVSDIKPRIRVEFFDGGAWTGYEPGEISLVEAIPLT